MKRLISIVLFILLAMVPAVQAGEITLTPYIQSTNDTEGVAQSRYGLELKYEFKNDFSLNLRQEYGELRFGGQVFGDLTTNEVGLGWSPNLTKELSLFIEIFYAMPEDVEPHKNFDGDGSGPVEGMGYYHWQQLGMKGSFEFASAEYRNAPGGTLGLSYDKMINKKFFCFNGISIGIMGGYKLLEMEEMTKQYNTGSPGWHVKRKRDLGGPKFGLNITFYF